MSLFVSLTDALPSPSLPAGELAANATGNVLFSVGPWSGFNDGDTVQLLGGFGNQILGSAVVTTGAPLLGGSAKVNSITVPVEAAALRVLGTGPCPVKARWIHKRGEAFGSKLSPETTIQIRGIG